MLRIVGCITQQHDLRLVAVAACICVLACTITVSLLACVQNKQRWSLIHLAAASIAFGGGVWSLHVVAMLAYASGVAIAYGMSLTSASIVLVVIGAALAFSVWQFSHSKSIGIVVGGVLLGSSISAMHFCGVMAMEVSGTVHFDLQEIMGSIVVSISLAVLALARAGALSTYRQRAETVLWFTLSICGLHFIAMTGLSFEPRLVGDQQAFVLGSNGLAIAVGPVSLAILVVSLAASLMEQYLSSLRTVMELRRLRTFNDLSQEVLIICRNGIALQVNAAGDRMFGTPGRQLVGRPVLDLIAELDRPVLLRQLAQADPGHTEISLLAANGNILTAELATMTIDYEGKPAVVIVLRDMSDRKEHEAKIRHLAHHDALTDLPNRVLLQERLCHALAGAARSGDRVALLHLDLDRFKAANDLFGHRVGDALLLAVAQRLLAVLRAGDTLARVAGDEFVIVAMVERPEEVPLLARRLVHIITQPFSLDVGQVEVEASVGVALYPADGTDYQELMRAADVALYRAKQEGRGTFRFFETSMDQHLQARQQLEHDLRFAIENGQLLLHYQPLISATSGEVDGFEALIRWQHPERGMIPPLEFIPLAEEIGLIEKIGHWVLATACEAASKWTRPHWVAVNVSPAQFRAGDLPETISGVLARTGLAANRLEIEVTEGILMEAPKQAADILSALRALGVRVAIDDFGSGYSSLSYLHEFKFDKLKIDRSFVMRIGQTEDAILIVSAIIDLGHKLGLSIAAEGVETLQQLKTLRDLKCDQMQGYLIGRPAEVDHDAEFVAKIARERNCRDALEPQLDATDDQLNIENDGVELTNRADDEQSNRSLTPIRALHVLVVDDVAMTREIAASFLRASGHQVVCVDGGAEAVVATASTDFDVVLMDVRMPEMDGLDATRRIRGLAGMRGRVPVVGLTAHAFPGQVSDCRRAGMSGHVSKPFDPDTLVAAVLRAAVAGPFGNTFAPNVEPMATSVAPLSVVIGSDLPILAPAVFVRTISCLAPRAAAAYLHHLAALGESIMLMLRSPDALACSPVWLAESAHTVGGGAGLFGFQRLSEIGGQFVQALASGSSEAPALAAALDAALDASLPAMYRNAAAMFDD